MFMVHRAKKNYYIDLVKGTINLAHLIYKKNAIKKGKAVQPAKLLPKNIRAKMMMQNLRKEKRTFVARKKTVSAKRKLIQRQNKGKARPLPKGQVRRQ